MTIYRRIFRMGILKDPLRPAISDDPPEGINWRVLAYEGNHAIVECWCSDHPILEFHHQKTLDDLKLIDHRTTTLAVLTHHPKSPKLLGQHAISVYRHSRPNADVDTVKKTVTFRGRKGSYLRMVKDKPHGKRDEDRYILDEG